MPEVADPSVELDMSSTTKLPPLYRHTQREPWGLAMIVNKLDDRVDMQFQDGRRRTFKSGFYHFLEAVDRPYDATVGIIDGLRSMFEEEGVSAKTRGDVDGRPISVDEQVAYFRELFEDGFVGEAYAEQHRSDGRKRPLKRHRDPSIEAARESLSKKALRADPSEVIAAMVKVLERTDLVPAKERKVFAEMDAAHHEPVVEALRTLLYGTSKIINRLDAFVRAVEAGMGVAPSWELATVFPALVHPKEHCVVSAKVYQRQAVWMAPGLRCSERPMGLLYTRLQAMAQGTRDRMMDEGLAPRDLIDVRDFMWISLKPAGRRRIMEIRARRRLDDPLPADAETAAA